MRLSFSLWSTYHQCPFKYKQKYLLGVKEPFSGPAAERGTKIHLMIEEYIKNYKQVMPWDEAGGAPGVPKLGHEHPMTGVLQRYRNWPNGMRHVERKFGFDIDWYPYPADNDDTAYVAVFDIAAVANGVVEIGEWKSGKPYPSHFDQRTFYGLAGLKLWPHAHKVQVTTYYADMTSEAKRITLTPDNERELQDTWESRRETIANDRIMAPRPNEKCNWCFYRKSNKGNCPLDY
jgi:CRISPR/Cas system-associated exonuclease Cas4 (RecB family)